MKKYLLVCLHIATILLAMSQSGIMSAQEQMLSVGESVFEHRLAGWGQIGACTRLDLIGTAGGGSYDISGTGALGIGYQLTYGKLLFTTGLEFASINYNHHSGASLGPGYPRSIMPYRLGYLQIPALLGMELPNWYWLLGGKFGYAVMQAGNDPVIPWRYGPAGEIGMNFDRWSQPCMHYKLALFAECGLFDWRASWTRWLKEDFELGVKFTVAYDFKDKK